MSQNDVATAVFAYEAQTVEGRVLRGTLEAGSSEEVQAQLRGLQLRVMTVAKEEGTVRVKGGLGADEFLMFNQQLAYLMEAGLPVEQGLRLIAMDLKSGRLSKAAEEVAGELERGVPLAEAFGRHASRFPRLYGKLMDAGARTGNLAGMLFNLGRHMELVGKLRRMLWRSLSYPAIVLAALSLVLLMVSVFILPQFVEIFKDFRTSLPVLTEMFLAMGGIYPTLFVVFWGGIALLVLLHLVFKAAGWRGLLVEGLVLHIPGIGQVVRANLVARWIDALRLGVESGLDLPRAVTLASDATGSAGLARDAEKMTGILTRGEPMGKFSGELIPATVPAAIELSARTGDLPGALMTLSRMYEGQAENRLRLLPAVLAPLIIVVIGGMIGLCVCAMFLPLVKLVQSVSGGG